MQPAKPKRQSRRRSVLQTHLKVEIQFPAESAVSGPANATLDTVLRQRQSVCEFLRHPEGTSEPVLTQFFLADAFTFHDTDSSIHQGYRAIRNAVHERVRDDGDVPFSSTAILRPSIRHYTTSIKQLSRTAVRAYAKVKRRLKTGRKKIVYIFQETGARETHCNPTRSSERNKDGSWLNPKLDKLLAEADSTPLLCESVVFPGGVIKVYKSKEMKEVFGRGTVQLFSPLQIEGVLRIHEDGREEEDLDIEDLGSKLEAHGVELTSFGKTNIVGLAQVYCSATAIGKLIQDENYAQDIGIDYKWGNDNPLFNAENGVLTFHVKVTQGEGGVSIKKIKWNMRKGITQEETCAEIQAI